MLGLERGFFLNHGIQLEWTDIGKGTGAMVGLFFLNILYNK